MGSSLTIFFWRLVKKPRLTAELLAKIPFWIIMEGGIAHFGLWSEGRKNIFNSVFQEGIDEHVDISQ